MEVSVLQSKGFYVIKKYADRKMYDLQRSCVVSLLNIEELILENKNIIVFDKDDVNITIEIFSDVFGKAVRRFRLLNRMPLTYLFKNKLIKLIKGLSNE